MTAIASKTERIVARKEGGIGWLVFNNLAKHRINERSCGLSNYHLCQVYGFIHHRMCGVLQQQGLITAKLQENKYLRIDLVKFDI